jgi:uncharacterized protein (DUF952 family)
MTPIYKILSRKAWEEARDKGRFDGAAIDLSDGYIHFSTAAQAQETARRHFVGADDLVVLKVNAEMLAPRLRWEPSRGGDLFPHLYGWLDTKEVVSVSEAPLDAAGVPQLGRLDP